MSWYFFGGFSVLHGAVRTPREPVRVLGHVRVIGRALERDVERNLDVELFCVGDEALKILHRAQIRVQCLVTAFVGAYGPWAAHLIRPGFQ